jgi:hypothetical protein
LENETRRLNDKELECTILEKHQVLSEYYRRVNSNDRHQIMEFLREYPKLIDYGFPTHRAKTIFHLSVISKNLDLFDELYKFHPSGLKNRDRSNRTPSFYAASTNDLTLLAKVLELGADIDEKDKKNFTPFYESIVIAKTKTSKFLLDHGANINIQTEMGRTPLIKAGDLISFPE